MAALHLLIVLACVAVQDGSAPAPAPVAVPGAARAAEPAEPAALVDRLWRWLGGRAAYDAVGALAFTYEEQEGISTVAQRSWLQDRKEGRVRLRMETKRGELVVRFKEDGSGGVAFENGKRVPAADEPGVVARAQDLWAGDSTWLLLPWRLCDAGMRLHVAPDRTTAEGVVQRQLEVTLDAKRAGPPGGVFRLLLDPETGALAGTTWRAAAAPEGAAAEFSWSAWETQRGLLFSTVKFEVDGTRVVLCRNLEVLESIDPDVFRSL